MDTTKTIKIISYRDPRTGNHLVNGRPLVRVCFETKLDEVFTLAGDIGPLGLGELVLTRPKNTFLYKNSILIKTNYLAHLILFFIPGEIG